MLTSYSIKKKLSLIFYKISNFFLIISKKIYTSPQEKRVRPWFKVNGDKSLRLEYNLNDKSTVLDLGGYEGQWASDIYSMYGCKIHIFEPVPEFSKKIKKRFIKNNNISVYEFGLSNKTCNASISLSDDSTSIYKKTNNAVEIKLVKAVDFFKEKDINKIDLIKINIEGAEYELLEHLIEAKYITQINNLQIQFHDFIQDADIKMNAIHRKLKLTHNLTYSFPYVWENWLVQK